MQYLVEGTGGPGFKSPEEVVEVLERAILPGFEHLIRLQTEKKVLAGGLPVGERALVFIVEAASNHEADQLVRGIPFWGALEWKVTPLQSIEGRAEMERAVVSQIKGGQR
jgi:hypothetical protein